MPFDRNIRNPRLIGEYLTVDYKGADGKTAQASINLDTVLGNGNGKFKWGSSGFKAVARDISLSGFELSAELLLRDGQWIEAKVDLSSHIRLRNNKLETFNIRMDPRLGSGSPASDSPSRRNTTSTPRSRTPASDPVGDPANDPVHESSPLAGRNTTSASRPRSDSVDDPPNDPVHEISPLARQNTTSTSTSGTPVSDHTNDPDNDPVQGSSLVSSSQNSITRTTSKLSFQGRTFSFFVNSVSKDKLHLDGYILSAECRYRGGSKSSTLDLKEYIGVAAGQLVWGRKYFLDDCKSVKLDGYNLAAECLYEGKTVKSTLDLSRYLQSYKGTLELKVAKANTSLSSLFSQARWMKVKEPNASVVVGEEFKDAFDSIAKSTAGDVIDGIQEEVTGSLTNDLRAILNNEVQAVVTRVVTNAVTKDMRSAFEKKAEAVFIETKNTLVETYNKMMDQAMNNVTIGYTESITGRKDEEITSQCVKAVENVISRIVSSTIDQFRERAEIMLESEMLAASDQQAQTEAIIFQLLQTTQYAQLAN